MNGRTLAAGLLIVLVGACSTTAPAPSLPARPSTPVAPTHVPTPVPATPIPATPVSSRAASSAPDVLYDPTADAKADIAVALAAAKADGKRVLLDFGADWCPDCHVLASYLEGRAGSALVESSFHVVRIDVGLFDHNLDIVDDYFQMAGIPEVVVLDASGKVIGASAEAGSLANARAMTERQVLDVIATWSK